MNKKNVVILLVTIMLGITGCGEKKADAIQDTEVSENTKVVENTELTSSEQTDLDVGNSLDRIIENQTFEVELDDWGKVTFASMTPESNSNEPDFVLLKDGKIIYTFPKTEHSNSDNFEQVNAVKFTDYNMDGKKDILILVQYSYEGQAWSEPIIFLADTAFSRDALLEEYLSKQHLTENIADMEGTWPDYMEYADSLNDGSLSVEKQIEIFAQERTTWATDVDYADERYCFTLADLDMDGELELIVSNFGGTGFYTYSRFYKIGDDGNIKELETTFTEGESQPDILDEISDESDMTVYYEDLAEGTGKNSFIVYDRIKDAPDSYVYRVSALSLVDDVVTETYLASQQITYEGEDYTERIVSEDYNGNELTEEEYENYPATYFEAANATKYTAVFKWKDISDVEEISNSDAVQMLTETYQNYTCK